MPSKTFFRETDGTRGGQVPALLLLADWAKQCLISSKVGNSLPLVTKNIQPKRYCQLSPQRNANLITSAGPKLRVRLLLIYHLFMQNSSATDWSSPRRTSGVVLDHQTQIMFLEPPCLLVRSTKKKPLLFRLAASARKKSRKSQIASPNQTKTISAPFLRIP